MWIEKGTNQKVFVGCVTKKDDALKLNFARNPLKDAELSKGFLEVLNYFALMLLFW